jgi:hypothetical protein
MVPDDFDLSPTAPVTENERGGLGSTALACSVLPGKAMLRLAGVFNNGARKYSANNWRKVDMQDHIDHVLQHLFAYLAGDKQDDHLGHAFCRLAMAVETEDESFDFTAERQLPQCKTK